MNADALKAELPEYLARAGIEPDRQDETRLVLLCPVHNEETPSFNAWLDGNVWRCKCFGCGFSGTVLDLHAKLHALDIKADFRAVAAGVAKVIGGTLSNENPRPKAERPPPPPPSQMSDGGFAIANAAAARLESDEELCGYVASGRWRRGTIQRLAAEGSLGWYNGKLAFLSITGIKTRAWPSRGSAGRNFKFEAGSAGALWRTPTRGRVRHAIVTEGETDAITAIDIGLDDDSTRVFALPSASTIPGLWAGALDGLDVVTLAQDADEAGEKSAARWTEILRGRVREIRRLDWGAHK